MKKFKLLSLALAFCMIASLIPAPVASAADGDVAIPYPEVIELKLIFPADVNSVTYGDLKNSALNPTLETNKFEIDWNKSGVTNNASKIWSSTPTVSPRLSKGGIFTFNVKAPSAPGEYYLYVEGNGTAISSVGSIGVTIGENDAVIVENTNTLNFVKVSEFTVTGTEEYIPVRFSNPGETQNFALSKLMIIPVGTVNMNFCMPEYAGGGPWNTTIQSPFWSYEKNGAEYVYATGAIPVANSKFTDTNFNHRGKVGSTLSFKFLVPDDGEYTATLLAGQVATSGNSGNWKITIDDTEMGTHSYWSEEVNHNLGDIELTAGEHTLTFECTSLNIPEGSTWSDSNNYLIGFTLTPVEEEEPEKAVIPESDIFGDVYAYVKDGDLYFIGGIEKDAIDGYAEVGFEVKVDGEEAGDINTTQVYTSFTIGSDTYKATEKFGSEYVFITKLENVGDASSVTVSPYVKDADGVKTFHVDDANNALALTLNLK